MDIDAKKIGEAIGFGILASYAFWNIVKTFWDFAKGMIKSTPPAPPKSSSKEGVTVNVGAATPPQDIQALNLPKEDVRYLLYFLLQQGKIHKAMHDLKSDILKEQMDYFNRHMREMEATITTSMVKYLYNKKQLKVISVSEYNRYLINFENFLDTIECKISNIFRSMCRDNHFSNYTPGEYRDVSNRNIAIITAEMSDTIRKRYTEAEFLDELPNLLALKKMVRDGLIDCFQHARQVSMEKQEVVESAKCSFEKHVSGVMGVPYTLDIQRKDE